MANGGKHQPNFSNVFHMGITLCKNKRPPEKEVLGVSGRYCGLETQ
jgi:hypothetical protein